MSDSPINEAVVRLAAMVENLTKNVDRLVDAQMQTTNLIQDLSKNQAIGTTTLAEHTNDIDDLKKDVDEIRDTVNDHKANWLVVKVGAALALPVLVAIVGAVAHLWFS